MTGETKPSPRAHEQLDELDEQRLAQAKRDREARAHYAEQQERRRAAARDARDAVRRARLDVEAAQDEFDRVAVAHRLDGTRTDEELSAAWAAVDGARMRLRAAEAVADALGGPGLG